jgi:DNA-binding transcriptional LysR family regulator
MNPSALDLHSLEAFIFFCECGSMTQAAQRLGVSQSAISQLVKRLERDMGVVLIDREERPAKLTSAGRALFDLGTELLAHSQTVAGKVRASAHADHGLLKLGCVDSFAATVGPELIRAFTTPTKEIRMWSGLTPTLAEQLAVRELDMVVCTDPMVTRPRISQIPLFSEGFLLVTPKGTERGPAPTVHELGQQLPLVRYSLRSLIGQQVERYLQHVGLQAPRRFEFDATDPLLSLVAAGLGWAISTPLCLWQSRHFLPEISVYALPDTALGRREFYLLSRRFEWGGLDEEVARVVRQVTERKVAPAVVKGIGAQVAGLIRFDV